MPTVELCPCGSGLSYAKCCKPIITEKKKAPTAESLMRSRYSAYAKHEIDWLYKSAGEQVQKEFDAEQTRKWAESATWSGIEVVAKEGGEKKDTTGVVEFIAHYSVGETSYDHHERSVFEKIDGAWRFIDGEVMGPQPFRRETPKVGRNDPCPCGSGKKYKKCCGKDA